MKYLLSYNENTYQFLIDETDQTLQSLPDEQDFKPVGRADTVDELRIFAETVATFRPLFRMFSGISYRFSQNYESVKAAFEARHITPDWLPEPTRPVIVIRTNSWKVGATAEEMTNAIKNVKL